VTEALYLTDPTLVAFEATVERTLSDPPRIVLDRTAFYPEGGGQPADRGRISVESEESGRDHGLRVTDVRTADAIHHHVADADCLPAAGTAVTGTIDRERRRAHSRYHTAQHLLSAVMLEAYDARPVGNQLYADRARIDVEHDRFEEADLERVATRMNELVAADLPVRWYEMDREVAEADLDPERTRLALLPDSITEVRIVEIGDPDAPFDRTACAGTHVEATGAIGEVIVTGRTTGGDGRERLSFTLAGT